MRMMGKKPPRPTPRIGDAEGRRDRIGDQLRQLYKDVANEPVPDEFMRLLEEADDAVDEDQDENEGSDRRGAGETGERDNE